MKVNLCFKRSVAIVLSFLILIPVVPLQVYAFPDDEATDIESATRSSDPHLQNAIELLERRNRAATQNRSLQEELIRELQELNSSAQIRSYTSSALFVGSTLLLAIASGGISLAVTSHATASFGFEATLTLGPGCILIPISGAAVAASTFEAEGHANGLERDLNNISCESDESLRFITITTEQLESAIEDRVAELASTRCEANLLSREALRNIESRSSIFKFGWDNVAYVEAMLAHAETLRQLFAQEEEETSQLLERLIEISQSVEEAKRTALCAAAERGNVEEVTCLVTSGVDVNIRKNDSEGATALMWAAHNGHLNVVDALISRGADLNAQDNEGDTALIEAARRGDLIVVEALLSKGANLDIQNNDGETALSYAESRAFEEITQRLRNARDGQ